VAVETLGDSYCSYASNYWRPIPRRRRHGQRSRVHRRFTDKSDYGPSFPAVNALIMLSTKAIGEMASVNQDTSTLLMGRQASFVALQGSRGDQ
jgi:hypothetical protein